MLKGRCVVIISPQWWGDYWVSKHWIAHELSKENRVLFVGPPIWLGGLVRSSYKEILQQIISHRRREINQTLHVFSPLIYPNIYTRFFSQTFSSGFAAQIKSEINRLNFQNVIVINFTTNHKLVKALGESLSIHYCVDPPFPMKDEDDHERLICEKSDLVLAVSENYRRRLSGFVNGKEVHVLPHGHDYEASQRVHFDSSVPIPYDLKQIASPIIAYVGSIHPSYVDVDFLIQLAKLRPKWNFVLIGPYKNNPLGPSLPLDELERLSDTRNIHILGPKKFQQLPQYIKFIDVGLILLNHTHYGEQFLLKQRTNFKIYQYLSQGKPLVAPCLDELESLTTLVYIGDSIEDYLKNIERALSEDPALRRARMNFASSFSFQNILTMLHKHIYHSELKAIKIPA